MKRKSIKTLRDLAKDCETRASALSSQVDKHVSIATNEGEHAIADLLHDASQHISAGLAELSRAVKYLEKAGNLAGGGK